MSSRATGEAWLLTVQGWSARNRWLFLNQLIWRLGFFFSSALPWQLQHLQHCLTQTYSGNQGSFHPNSPKNLAKLYRYEGRTIWLPRQRFVYIFYNWEGPIGSQAIQRNVWSIPVIVLSKKDRFAASSHRRLRLKTRVNPRIHACLRTSLFWYRLKGLDNVVLYERETKAVWARGWH